MAAAAPFERQPSIGALPRANVRRSHLDEIGAPGAVPRAGMRSRRQPRRLPSFEKRQSPRSEDHAYGAASVRQNVRGSRLSHTTENPCSVRFQLSNADRSRCPALLGPRSRVVPHVTTLRHRGADVNTSASPSAMVARTFDATSRAQPVTVIVMYSLHNRRQTQVLQCLSAIPLGPTLDNLPTGQSAARDSPSAVADPL